MHFDKTNKCMIIALNTHTHTLPFALIFFISTTDIIHHVLYIIFDCLFKCVMTENYYVSFSRLPTLGLWTFTGDFLSSVRSNGSLYLLDTVCVWESVSAAIRCYSSCHMVWHVKQTKSRIHFQAINIGRCLSLNYTTQYYIPIFLCPFCVLSSPCLSHAHIHTHTIGSFSRGNFSFSCNTIQQCKWFIRCSIFTRCFYFPADISFRFFFLLLL